MLLLVSFNFCFFIVNLILNLTLNLILNIGLILILKLILKFDFSSDFEFDFVSLDCRFVVLQVRVMADLRTPSCQDLQLSGSRGRQNLRPSRPQAVSTPGRQEPKPSRPQAIRSPGP